MKTEQLKVGQIVYREEYSRNEPPKITEWEVISIGRKYARIKYGWREEPINKSTLKYEDRDYHQRSFQVYLTIQ